jgi:hypothetical protein
MSKVCLVKIVPLSWPALFIKAATGQWKARFGYPGDAKVLRAQRHGFPDIEVLGPGPGFPVWRYNGQQYDIVKKCR